MSRRSTFYGTLQISHADNILNENSLGNLFVEGDIKYVRNGVDVDLTASLQRFNYTQTIASDTWVIQHNLNTEFPIVKVYDDEGDEVLAVVTTDNTNHITIKLAVPGTGSVLVLKTY